MQSAFQKRPFISVFLINVIKFYGVHHCYDSPGNVFGGNDPMGTDVCEALVSGLD